MCCARSVLRAVDTPVLILTGDLDTDTKLRGFGGGADDYLTKPFHREEFGRAHSRHYPPQQGSCAIGHSPPGS